MIARYSRPEMAGVWEDRHKYLVWLWVELSVCEEMARLKIIPSSDWLKLKKEVRALEKKGGLDPKRVEHHESATRHDMIAFTTALAEQIGPVSRYIHFGLTSSDVVDTSLSLQIQEAGSLLMDGISALLKTLEKRAKEYRDLPTIGRSHGIFAEPTSFGLKFLGWHCEWKRNQTRLKNALESIRVGKLSGAVGVNPHFGPDFESRVLARLGLKREPISTQIIPRDRHAEFLSVLALCGSSIERMAVELRHLQRSEVGEVLESFHKGQKGSSAMPHKRNPISSENLTGIARLLRSYSQAAFENVALWHERDISHSSVERVILPDSTLLLDYALHRMNQILGGLVVREKQVRDNLERASSIVYSGHFLLALVQAGATREQAYRWVQECALASLDGSGDFVRLVLEHREIRNLLSPKQIKELGSSQYQLRHVRALYREALRN